MERHDLLKDAIIKYYYIEDDKPEKYIGCAFTEMFSEVVKMFSVIKNEDITCCFNDSFESQIIESCGINEYRIVDIQIQLPTEVDLLVINIYLE